ncbi:Amidase signature domain [Trinorchestia longiramus]|nr:Amidase signature domain [Trinorchestia longiramus]
MEKILSLTLIELAQAYKQKSLSVSQVVQQVMAQISIMQDLNALISVTPEEKISRACAGAQERPRPRPLARRLTHSCVNNILLRGTTTPHPSELRKGTPHSHKCKK